VRVLVSPAPVALENPYLVMLYDAMVHDPPEVNAFSSRALLRRADVIHVHWPEYLVRWPQLPVAVFDVIKVVTLLGLARARGAAVVWTGHNLEPHELRRRRLWRIFFWLFLGQTDLLISMSSGATELLRARYPRIARTRTVVIPHGDYRYRYTGTPDVRAVRNELGIDASPVFLAFGQVRPYKNLPGLVRALREMSPPEMSLRPQLVIAGKPIGTKLADEIRLAAQGDSQVHLLLRYVADDEVAGLFAVADVVVASYLPGSALNSGVALLALSFGRPVVLTDGAASRDLQSIVGADWVRLCDGTPDDALRVAADLASEAGGRTQAMPDLSSLAWEAVGVRTLRAYADAVATRRGRRTRLHGLRLPTASESLLGTAGLKSGRPEDRLAQEERRP